MTTNHLFEHLSTPMILIDLSGKIQALNKQARELLNDVDLVVVMVGHDELKQNIDLLQNKIVLDTRNIMERREGVYKL